MSRNPKQIALTAVVCISLAALSIAGLYAMVSSLTLLSSLSSSGQLEGLQLTIGIALFVAGLTMTLGAAASAFNIVTGKGRGTFEHAGRRSPLLH